MAVTKGKKVEMAQNVLKAEKALKAVNESVVRKVVRRGSGTVFGEEYQKLNPAQRLAVDTIEGPVMVIAGPGSGKTQVLALRAANILRRTQMRPGNILCLTFSRSGAASMRSRLRQLIGSDAYSITIGTIHGFCNDIIRDHPNVFADFSALAQISDVEQYRELNKIIDQHMPGLSLVSAKAPHLRTGDILSRIGQLKREGVADLKRLDEVAAAYDAAMAGKSGEGTKARDRDTASAVKFREFLAIFFAYQEMLLATNRYDYEDMILYVLEALLEQEWMLQSLQERYQYILVDEFQDLNGAQNRFVEILTEDPTGDARPNLFIVGDDDQAIYRFQGANVKNILAFRERFPKAPVICLEESYRCSQKILDAAGSLVAHNTERIVSSIEGLEKNLVSASGRSDGPKPTLYLSESDALENWMIADIIADRLAAGVKPADIAVLVQTNRELESLYSVLTARGIPAELRGAVDLLMQGNVRQAVAILRAIHHPEDSHLLVGAIAADCFALHPADIGRLTLARREEGCSFLEILVRLEDLGLPLKDLARVLSVRDTLLSLHQKIPTRSIVETLEHVFRDCGLLGSSPPDVLDLVALQEFFDRVRARAEERPDLRFEDLLQDLSLYSDPSSRGLRMGYEIPRLTAEGVQLMTAHQSKGLEFHTVILRNFREGHWDRRRRPATVSVPEDLLFGWNTDMRSIEQREDERRLAYVAMTRAKRELVFTCPARTASGEKLKDVSPSGFFAEAGELPEVHRAVRDPGTASTLLHTPLRDLDEEFALLLRKRLEDFRLSATALNHFLEDPRMFLGVDLLHMPQSKSAYFAYGNAVHHMLAKWALSVKAGAPLSEADLLGEFRSHLKQREVLAPSAFDNLVYAAEATLPAYFRERLVPPFPVIDRVEFNVTAHLRKSSDVTIEGIPLKGKIDRIDLAEMHSSRATVIDYKTGKPRSESAIREGEYFRQLAFYAVLLEESSLPYHVEEFIFDFIGDETNGPVMRRFAITDREKQEMRKLIGQVWEKIAALDFTPL